ncbi:hypothetical protein SDC9_173947 [bioreactor metagenome]|uniref:Uncharacterized protein n=1 Tax=bioreactor metagenome TaxID=1076179 RepID=A0A645GKX3_9ZZZZ
MGREQGKCVAVAHLDIHLSKATTNLKTAAIQQETLVRVRAALHDWETAQHGHKYIGIPTFHVLDVRQVESAGLKGGLQLPQRGFTSHLLQRDDIGPQGEDVLFNFCLRGF